MNEKHPEFVNNVKKTNRIEKKKKKQTNTDEDEIVKNVKCEKRIKIVN